MAVMASWRGMKWEVSPKIIRPLTGLTTAYKLKSVSDTEEATNKVKGYELQVIAVHFDITVAAGGNPRGEYERWLTLVGETAPFYLAGRRFGPPRVRLDEVGISNVVLANQGGFLVATISLNFTEDSTGGTPAGDLQILHSGVDIYNDISLHSCIHDMYAASRSDEVVITFNDTQRLWDGWAPGKEEKIEISDGAAGTGEMFIESVVPENGMMTLRAYSIPPTAKDKTTKSWENVRLLQLGEEIAGRHGLRFETFDLTDQLYAYVRQDNLPDFTFLEQRCALEGAGYLVYDGTLVMYGEAALESAEPGKSLRVTTDSSFEYRDDASQAYGSAEITNGDVTGSFSTSNGSTKALQEIVPIHMENQAEANRLAAGLLRYYNREMAAGSFQTSILRDLAAGSVASLETEGAGSWDGPVFLHHVRHDYVKETSKLFFRRPLEGY